MKKTEELQQLEAWMKRLPEPQVTWRERWAQPVDLGFFAQTIAWILIALLGRGPG